MPQAEADELLSGIEVGEVWGVGRRIGLQLHAAGISTVKALRDAPPSWLRSRFGVVMERTGNESMEANWTAYIWWYGKRYYSFIGDGESATTFSY